MSKTRVPAPSDDDMPDLIAAAQRTADVGGRWVRPADEQRRRDARARNRRARASRRTNRRR